jgi:hypothetical protein
VLKQRNRGFPNDFLSLERGELIFEAERTKNPAFFEVSRA